MALWVMAVAASLAASFAMAASLVNGTPRSLATAARYVSRRAASSAVAMSASFACARIRCHTTLGQGVARAYSPESADGAQ